MTAGISTKSTGPRHRRATRPARLGLFVIALIALVCAVVLAFVVTEAASASVASSAGAPPSVAVLLR